MHVYVCLLFTERVLDAATKIYSPTALVPLYRPHMYVHVVEVSMFENPCVLGLVKRESCKLRCTVRKV